MKMEYENPWFKVVKDGKFHFIKENCSDNGAVVLALIDEQFIFVEVERPAHKLISLETPRGYGNLGENSESCAIRELYEETGFLLDSEGLERIGLVRPNTAILSSSIPVYLIESNQVSRRKLIDSEISNVVFIPRDDIHKEVASGKITDGITLSALSLYWAKKHNKQSQSDA
jgi:ADP-ribose pyrophosphatase